ncbi:MAG TPA: site-2 protease family protein [Bacteroidetes bacterium]|nr:site-2 protease family protein [Bacteroidota bacterium]
MIEQILFIPILLLSIIIHECAHGYAALRAGDPTAKLYGRLTLNPIPHIDLVGSIILPAFLILTNSSFLFGWAKPVPVNPNYFRKPRRDEIIVSAAGPLSNIVLSLIFLGLTIIGIAWFNTTDLPYASVDKFFLMLRQAILINLVLAFFNLIPIPPLDGSHILANLLPPHWAEMYDKIRPFGFIILIVIIASPLIEIAYIPVRIMWLIYQAIMRLFL